MRKIFDFAIERDWLQTNPCQMIKAPAKNVQRDRLLAEDEVAKFWEATEHEQPTPRAAIGRMREARLCPPRVAPKTRRGGHAVADDRSGPHPGPSRHASTVVTIRPMDESLAGRARQGSRVAR